VATEPELYEIPERENRQTLIETLPIGETISISRRVDLTFGVNPEALSEHTKQVRGILDQQTHRARRKHKTHEYKVENGSFLTREGAIILTAACTRVA
jgi:flagellar motor switch protein FliG